MSLDNKVARREFEKACWTIVRAKCKPGSFMDYAKSYANAGITCCFTNEAIKVQSAYILNNIRYWRGNTAKATRTTLKWLHKEA
jgi:hypothetical protein